MKKVTLIILSLFFLALVSPSFAGNGGDNTNNNPGGSAAKTMTLTGKVIDQNNQEALAGALIRIEGTELETYTDFEGNFSFSGISLDTYKIQCSMISYSDREEEIDLDQTSGEVVIALQNLSVNQACQ
jgi:hypothetical protein